MENCLFCKIIKKEIPADIIYEDNKNIAILDISPVNYGHILVIPKEHNKNIIDFNIENSKKLLKLIQDISKKLIEKLPCDGINIIQNNLPAAGQVIDHIHFHIIPRYKNDGFKHWKGKKQDKIKNKEIINKIKI